MPMQRLKAFLDENEVKYVTIRHSPAYTAQEIAACAHISGRELAKTVIVRAGEELAMAVMPANEKVNLELLTKQTKARAARIATEDEFAAAFPGCDVGAMPPFGNLWGMKVFASPSLREDERIAFNAGNHTELVQMDYADFERLVQPRLLEFATLATLRC